VNKTRIESSLSCWRIRAVPPDCSRLIYDSGDQFIGKGNVYIHKRKIREAPIGFIPMDAMPLRLASWCDRRISGGWTLAVTAGGAGFPESPAGCDGRPLVREACCHRGKLGGERRVRGGGL